jgi:plasmid stabilization system protein ParE
VRVIYSPRAISDLIEIANYLNARSPAGALAVEQRIRRTIALLAEFPGVGRPLEQRSQVRVMPLGRYPYLIFYTISGDELSILHVRHGARKPIEPESL